PFVLASTALVRRLGPGYIGFDGAYVKLRPGYRPGTAGRQAEALAQRFPATRGHVFVADEGAQAAGVERSIRPEVISLAIFALVLAIAALIVVGQAATRLIAAAQPANPVLAALGMTRGQLMAAGLLEGGGAGAPGGRGGGVGAPRGCCGRGRRGGRGVAADANRDGAPGRAGPRGQRRLGGAHSGGGCHRGARPGTGGAPGLAPGVGGQRRPGGSGIASRPVESRRVARGGRRAGDGGRG